VKRVSQSERQVMQRHPGFSLLNDVAMPIACGLALHRTASQVALLCSRFLSANFTDLRTCTVSPSRISLW
jgi:hypothetical protein